LKDKYNIPDIVDSVPYDPKENLPLNYILWKTLVGAIDANTDQNAYQSAYKK